MGALKPAVDQYATAATLYRLLTKKHLYNFPADATEKLLVILEDHPVPIHRRRQDIPPKLAGIIHRGLARRPEDRFFNVWAMREALLGFVNGT